MLKNFFITDISRILLVGKSKHPEKQTKFNSNLIYNELIYHFSGDAEVRLGEYVLHTETNVIRFMPKGKYSMYEVKRKEHGECIDIIFSSDRPAADKPFVLKTDNKNLGALFKKIFALWIAKSDGYLAECLTVLYKIISEINSYSYNNSEQSKKIQPAWEYIDAHFLEEKISSATLEKVCGISYSYIKRLFALKFGVSPKKYILNKKIDYACDLLRTDGIKITEVANLCGYEDRYFFSRQFKEYTGISPLKFSKKYK